MIKKTNDRITKEDYENKDFLIRLNYVETSEPDRVAKELQLKDQRIAELEEVNKELTSESNISPDQKGGQVRRKKMKTLNAKELKEHFRNHMSVDVVEIDGQAYACTRWNGEQWLDCWQIDAITYKPVNDCQISIDYDKSTYQVEDENNNQRVCKLQEMHENECIIQDVDEFYKTI